MSVVRSLNFFALLEEYSCCSEWYIKGSHTLYLPIFFVVLAGYKSLKNVDNFTCLSFCRQDENCASVVYSQLHPPFKNSNCRFFNNTVNLTLVEPGIFNPPRRSVLIIPESTQKGFYKQAALIGKPFLVDDSNTLEDCDDQCFNRGASSRFCDAYTFNYTSAASARCSLYTKENITSIVYSDGASTRF